MEILLAAVEMMSTPDLFAAEKKTLETKKKDPNSETKKFPSIVLEESVSATSLSTMESVKPLKIDGPDRVFGAEDYFVSVISMFETSKQQKLPTPDISDNTYLTFPQKLYLLISYDSNHCIEWCEEGTAFCILNKTFLVDYVIPKYFKQSDFRSFTRQINVYSFSRFRMNNISDYCYRHPFFRQGQTQGLLVMSRRKPAFKRGADRRSLEKKKVKKQKVGAEGETGDEFDEEHDEDHEDSSSEAKDRQSLDQNYTQSHTMSEERELQASNISGLQP